MSRPRGRFPRSKARQGDSLGHQIPAPCPHPPPPHHGIYIDRCIIFGGAYTWKGLFSEFTVFFYQWCMITSLCDLVSMWKIQKNSYFQTWSESLIIIHIKNKPPLWKRSIASPFRFWVERFLILIEVEVWHLTVTEGQVFFGIEAGLWDCMA